MISNEKLTYLNGLVKSMKLNEGTEESKLLYAIIGALNEMSESIESFDEALDGMSEVVSDLEESVYELEDEVFGEERTGFEEYDSFDDDIYEITCANCDKTITVDYDALDNGSVECPNCGELIEFTIEED